MHLRFTTSPQGHSTTCRFFLECEKRIRECASPVVDDLTGSALLGIQGLRFLCRLPCCLNTFLHFILQSRQLLLRLVLQILPLVLKRRLQLFLQLLIFVCLFVCLGGGGEQVSRTQGSSHESLPNIGNSSCCSASMPI